MEDYLIVMAGAVVMVLSGWLQYTIARNLPKLSCLLPLLFAILTFWLGFISLLFAFVLIFINEFSYVNQKPLLKKK